ncbi:DNA-binding response regulator [Terrihabitans soli]|uniref:DNA-binding response regulator n=1 Tax=Terrihabitans soli TaxID=708113 RepID=A0A6S6QXG8_9HYPH|nr:response regulator [Terrihabitans soli]BCJ91258.1 DNA-binding response regulator [Terrihabitans soli]
MTKIFIIDDQTAVRNAIAEMLSVFGFTAETFESAETFLERHPGGSSDEPACIVCDVRMPGIDGIEFVRQCMAGGRSVPVILISGHADVPMAVAGIKAGAADFIEKPVDDASLVAAINRAIAPQRDTNRDVQRARDLDQKFSRLTPRQTEVFDLVVAGFTSHAIADRLGLSTRTVESYRAQIMDKMAAESVAILVRQAIQLGRTAP